jgi:hypothetical protein
MHSCCLVATLRTWDYSTRQRVYLFPATRRGLHMEMRGAEKQIVPVGASVTVCYACTYVSKLHRQQRRGWGLKGQLAFSRHLGVFNLLLITPVNKRTYILIRANAGRDVPAKGACPAPGRCGKRVAGMGLPGSSPTAASAGPGSITSVPNNKQRRRPTWNCCYR